MNAYVALETGRVFRGRMIGAPTGAGGELVFRVVEVEVSVLTCAARDLLSLVEFGGVFNADVERLHVIGVVGRSTGREVGALARAVPLLSVALGLRVCKFQLQLAETIRAKDFQIVPGVVSAFESVIPA